MRFILKKIKHPFLNEYRCENCGAIATCSSYEPFFFSLCFNCESAFVDMLPEKSGSLVFFTERELDDFKNSLLAKKSDQ